MVGQHGQPEFRCMQDSSAGKTVQEGALYRQPRLLDEMRADKFSSTAHLAVAQGTAWWQFLAEDMGMEKIAMDSATMYAQATSLTRHIQGLNLNYLSRSMALSEGLMDRIALCIARPPSVHRSKARLGERYRDPASPEMSSMLSVHEVIVDKLNGRILSKPLLGQQCVSTPTLTGGPFLGFGPSGSFSSTTWTC